MALPPQFTKRPPFGATKNASDPNQDNPERGSRISKMRGGDDKKKGRAEAIQRRLARMQQKKGK